MGDDLSLNSLRPAFGGRLGRFARWKTRVPIAVAIPFPAATPQIASQVFVIGTLTSGILALMPITCGVPFLRLPLKPSDAGQRNVGRKPKMHRLKPVLPNVRIFAALDDSRGATRAASQPGRPQKTMAYPTEVCGVALWWLRRNGRLRSRQKGTDLVSGLAIVLGQLR